MIGIAERCFRHLIRLAGFVLRVAALEVLVEAFEAGDDHGLLLFWRGCLGLAGLPGCWLLFGGHAYTTPNPHISSVKTETTRTMSHK